MLTLTPYTPAQMATSMHTEGRGEDIASIDCQENGLFVVTFRDGGKEQFSFGGPMSRPRSFVECLLHSVDSATKNRDTEKLKLRISDRD